MKTHKKRLLFFLFVVLAVLLTPITVRADMAPPQLPPGTNIVPGSETTQVRMVAETVTLTVLPKPSSKYLGQAATEAVFTMRNLGTKSETMEARFPLTFWNNESDGYLKYPEIPDIRVLVDGKPTETHRIEVDYPHDPDTGKTLEGMPYHPTPWAAFKVTFPPGKDVIVTVKYTSNGDYVQTDDNTDPYFSLRYILETGAGWKDTIGSADIVVKLPYEANTKNVLFNRMGGEVLTTLGAKLNSNEIRWHFDNFEPTADSNIEITLVQASTWQKVLDETKYLQAHPNDGEAWGQLGKAYKDIVLPAFNKGYPRVDPFQPTDSVDVDGREMYQLSIQAYQKAVSLLPKDALWHYGFADLFWRHLHWRDFDGSNAQDIDEVDQMADQIRQALKLDPNNQNVRNMADWWSDQYPWAITKTDNGYDFPALTATPTTLPATEMPTREATLTPQVDSAPTQTAAPAAETEQPVSPTKTPMTGQPLCGAAAIMILPALAVFWLAAKKKDATHL